MPKVKHIAWVRKIWGERGGLIIFLFLLTLLSSAVAVAYPYLAKLLLDTIQRLLESPQVTEPMAQVNRLLLVFVAVGLAGLVASIFPGIRGMTNSVFEHLIRVKYFREVLEKNYTFFARFASGDIVTRLTDDLYDFPKLGWFLCSGIFRAVESISKVAFCLAAMFMINPQLTLLSIIPIPIMILIFYVTSDRIYSTFQKNQEAISAINSRLEMSFSGVRIIKAYACEHKYQRFFRDVLETRRKTETAVAKLEIVLHLIYQYIDQIAQIGIVFGGGIMAVRGSISVGTFYAFYSYLSMLIYPILDIPQLFVSGKRAFVNIDRLEEMRQHPSPPPCAIPTETGPIESLEFRGISFGYGDRPGDAVSAVNLTLKRGERIGIIGPVGAGKSTLIKLMLGLLPAREGRILVNGRELADIDLAGYRQRLGYVPQEALLFSGSLRENIDFACQEPTDQLFNQAVEAAQMKEEIASFAEGEKTVVGQRGISLSGGQKQRMAIARAIARRPEVMLFDDITASLDAANEERLMRALEAMSKDLSFCIVSHRLSTLQYVDKVLFLKDGRSVGFGTHDELLQNPAYKEFIREHLGRDAEPARD
ncbi:MAG: ABC transporter permease [Spirochaetes bacterium GWD1_61_31]|nr:MAG: ABC transporter permease [Spirochaetes bacterium GWB1_60_80]OHD35498.1 MAG: ABC transporter permease [Spirochaetes bacterium GWC1_61_12]OHD36735.1 MAG: ABC transporter permease [Spirochaetes bacterium GWD1_61_31]OHD42536.1 MAG: ABC transporter permease [Spirochaetes bacterium GWE1_60_18]OHD58254.1 MAG: ABC transporter permease [Spirochaetes bacterium GWF1_60_12]